jgi:mannose-6-phosphate isomerase-like protein (cupin superfamily)
MKPIDGYFLIKPEDLNWKLANPMKVPFADLLEHTKSELLGARLWRFPPKSANTLHKHVRAEEFYFVLEGVGRIRVGDTTLTVPKYGGVIVGPEMLRQVFNDTDEEVLWLMIGAPENEFGPGESFDIKRFWPVDPKQLPKELDGVVWPPEEERSTGENLSI